MSVELLIVDNGSTDAPKNVSEASNFPRMQLRYLTEPRLGKGYAYNTALTKSNGDVLLFTDDDVRVPHNWIEGMCSPILAGEVDAVAGGVSIAPHLRRDWMNSEQRAWLASTDRVATEPSWRMVGANMAFSRRILTKIPRFDINLGPGALGFEDETLLSLQIIAAGFRTARRLDFEVEHHFDPDRLTRTSLLALADKMGRSAAYVERHWMHYHRSRPTLKWVKHVLELKVRQAWDSSISRKRRKYSRG